MQYLYTILIHLYGIAIRLAALFNAKAKLWLEGRKKYFINLDNALKNLPPQEKRAWFHCSSLGEFEQGRPLIEAFKQKYPEIKIILTFFSPSGYEIRKNYAGADLVLYMPLDTKRNAQKFIEKVNPSMAVFVKYDYWFNFLKVLHTQHIPTYVVSAIFRNNSMFFKWYGKWAQKYLRNFAGIFVQDTNSKELLRSIDIQTNVTISGDTRFDRVYTIASQPQNVELVKKFSGNQTVLIAGSTWQADEELLVALLQQIPDLKCVIAPHEIGEQHIAGLLQKLNGKAVLFTDASDETINTYQVLIINKIGLLAHIYPYGQLAYIGGGFGAGIHNTLEAAVFGLPLFFGTNYQKFKEAKDLIALGGAHVIRNAEDLERGVNMLLQDKEMRKTQSDICTQYVKNNVGATKVILESITV